MSSPNLRTVSCVRLDQLEELVARLDEWGFDNLSLDGLGIANGSQLWQGVATQLKVPQSIVPKSWDGFNDAVFEVLVSAGGERVALVWNHAEVIVNGDLQDLLLAASIFESAAVAAYQRGVEAKLFLAGEGPGFRSLADVSR